MKLLFAGENLLLTKYITGSDYVLIDFRHTSFYNFNVDLVAFEFASDQRLNLVNR